MYDTNSFILPETILILEFSFDSSYFEEHISVCALRTTFLKHSLPDLAHKYFRRLLGYGNIICTRHILQRRNYELLYCINVMRLLMEFTDNSIKLG